MKRLLQSLPFTWMLVILLVSFCIMVGLNLFVFPGGDRISNARLTILIAVLIAAPALIYRYFKKSRRPKK